MYQKLSAEFDARKVPRVRAVDNRIVVHSAVLAQDVLDRIADEAATHARMAAHNVRVDVSGRVVTLVGTVPSWVTERSRSAPQPSCGTNHGCISASCDDPTHPRRLSELTRRLGTGAEHREMPHRRCQYFASFEISTSVTGTRATSKVSATSGADSGPTSNTARAQEI